MAVVDTKKRLSLAPGLGFGSRYGRVLEYRPTKEGEALFQAAEVYQVQTYKKLNSLLRQPETPLLSSPEVARVLLLPRTNEAEGTLTLTRFVYLILRQSRWVLEDPFAGKEVP